MTYDRDYILRMAREFATFLARIVRSKDAGKTETALADLDQAAHTHVGLGMDVLEALPVDQLTLMLSIGGQLDVNRAYATGRLLAERSDMARSVGNDALAATLDGNALQLLVDAALAFGEFLNDGHRAVVNEVSDRLLASPAPVAPTLVCALLDAHQRFGQHDDLARIGDLLVTRANEPVDRMTAIRIATRGACPEVVGRVATAER
jgi:hypothetical protein